MHHEVIQLKSTMNSKLTVLALLYFVQGMPYGLQSSLLPIYLRTSGLSLTKISLTKALYFPWILKIIWAPFVDNLGTKKKWLLITMSGLAVTCLVNALLSPDTDFAAVALALLTMNFLSSVQDIAVDGIAVRLLRQEEVGYGNTVQVVGYKIGSVLAGGGLLTVMDVIGWSSLFVMLSTVYCVVALYTWKTPVLNINFINQSNEEKSQKHTLNPWKILQELLSVPGTQWTLVFVLIYKLGEQGAMSMFPLFLLDSHMSARELGIWNGMVAMGFSILGSSIGGLLMSKYRAISVMTSAFIFRLGGLAFQTFLVFAFTGSSLLMKGAAILSLCMQHFLGGLITTVTFSIMMYCTQKADQRIQATHYSFLATLEVMGKLTFSALVGGVVDWIGFPASFFLFLILSAAAVVHVFKAPVSGS
ncbi:major facilitator superfamily domain-containing protein 3 isoform X1 [Lepisosteus oculatus]|uniref:major facilitator superfamily domain-containing protein 3 isoform X1 n=1 Tax=Lepisosteus oculatus TaxID=7918 RepID=UPI003713CC3D